MACFNLFSRATPVHLTAQTGVAFIGAVSLLVLGCGGSVNANASAKASTEGEADFDAAGDGGVGWEQTPDTQTNTASGNNVTGSSATNAGTLLGARHDLLLAEGVPATCRCLAVVVGQPDTPQMIWTGRRPSTNPQNQTVIVLGSEGILCSEANTGASYMGYEVKDGNVIVNVEAAVAGRPVTHGAIIPKPSAGGQIYVQPSGNIPYGRSRTGEPRCAVGVGK